MKALDVFLARGIKNPVLRSAIVNGVIAVAVAAVTALQAQLADGTFNWSLVAGAATAALLKWAHSTATDFRNFMEVEAAYWASVAEGETTK